jgi:hypothetical protein
MRPISSVATFSTILVLLSAAAWADDNLNCDAYAAKAVEQQQENRTIGCGFAGPAWSTDGQGHRNWCWLPQVQMVDLVKWSMQPQTIFSIEKWPSRPPKTIPPRNVSSEAPLFPLALTTLM